MSCSEPEAQVWSENGHCYFRLNATEDRWADQRDACENVGAHLVTITSQQEQDFVVPFVGAQSRWIGLQKTGDDFAWVTGESFGYENWQQGDPNEPNEACVRIRENGDWSDRTCDQSMGAICERE